MVIIHFALEVHGKLLHLAQDTQLNDWRSSEPKLTWLRNYCQSDTKVLFLKLPCASNSKYIGGRGCTLSSFAAPYTLGIPYSKYRSLSYTSLCFQFPNTQGSRGCSTTKFFYNSYLPYIFEFHMHLTYNNEDFCMLKSLLAVGHKFMNV